MMLPTTVELAVVPSLPDLKLRMIQKYYDAGTDDDSSMSYSDGSFPTAEVIVECERVEYHELHRAESFDSWTRKREVAT